MDTILLGVVCEVVRQIIFVKLFAVNAKVYFKDLMRISILISALLTFSLGYKIRVMMTQREYN